MLKNWFHGIRKHNDPDETQNFVKKELYRELLDLLKAENEIQAALELPIKPELTIVDETHLVLLSPNDRKNLGLDKEMREVINEKQNDKEKAK